MATRKQEGSVQLDKRTGTWFFRWYENGARRAYRLGTLSEYPDKKNAESAAEHMRVRINSPDEPRAKRTMTVAAVANRYMNEKMPPHFSTRSGYLYNLTNHILPRWGKMSIASIRPAAVSGWLDALKLAPKTKANLKSLLGILIEQAMFWEYLDLGRNPMELVKIRGCTLRQEEPRILTVAEFHRLLTSKRSHFAPCCSWTCASGCASPS